MSHVQTVLPNINLIPSPVTDRLYSKKDNLEVWLDIRRLLYLRLPTEADHDLNCASA